MYDPWKIRIDPTTTGERIHHTTLSTLHQHSHNSMYAYKFYIIEWKLTVRNNEEYNFKNYDNFLCIQDFIFFKIIWCL